MVGSCPTSNSLYFFQPFSKQLLSCADEYRLGTFSPSSPQLNLQFDDIFAFNTKSNGAHYHLAPTHRTTMSKYIKLDNSYVEVKIISPPVDPSHESYVVQLCVSGDIKEVSHENLLDYDPTPQPLFSRH